MLRGSSKGTYSVPTAAIPHAALCSFAALTMAVEISLISLIIAEKSPIADTASPVAR